MDSSAWVSVQDCISETCDLPRKFFLTRVLPDVQTDKLMDLMGKCVRSKQAEKSKKPTTPPCGTQQVRALTRDSCVP